MKGGGGGGEPPKGSMGGNVPMAPLKPDHVLKGDAFCSSKKNQHLCFHIVLTNPLLAYSNKDLKNIEMGRDCFGYLTVRLHTLLKVQDQKPTPF